MGIIVRENTAPITDGETASGAEVEAEFNKVFTEFNGRIENVNIAADAAIAGSKLAALSVPGSVVEADAITTAKMAAAAVPKAYVATSTATETFTTSTTFVDVPGITAATMTPGSTGDIIMCDLTFSATSVGDSFAAYSFGFNVDGQAATDIQGMAYYHQQRQNVNRSSHTVTWATAAPATTSMVIKPVYKVLNAGSSTFDATAGLTKVFRVLIVPTK